MNTKHLIYIFITLILVGCTPDSNDFRLSKVAELVDVSPENAMAALDSINYNQLSPSDQNYYDLLTIKALDKAYITHSSDSLILKVIDFESKHQANGRYPESLYYGGRVYSDLGDYPTAIYYFQNALELLNNSDTQTLKLKRRVLSQTGRLLTSISLYEQALPYIESAVEINQHLQDTLAVVQDLQLLGGTYLRSANYKSAEKCFKESMLFSHALPISYIAKSKMYLAEVKFKNGQLDSALTLIRGTQQEVRPLVRNNALAYASNIYLHAEILDSAYLFAHQLINSDYSLNKEIGYQVLLSQELRPYIPSDTLDKYISDYRALLENYYDENETQLEINQYNAYNYQLHERERIKAENSKNDFQRWLLICFLIALLLFVIVLILKNKNKSQRLELHKALDDLSKLKQNLDIKVNEHIEVESQSNEPSDLTEIIARENMCNTSDSTDINTLRKRLREELLSISQSDVTSETPEAIIQAEAYQELQMLIRDNKRIQDNSTLWNELEKAVLDYSPQFIHRLQLLTGGKLKPTDIRIAVLVKCGVTPTQIAALIGRTKGTVSYQREMLCKKVFDEQLGAKVIDNIIRLL